MECNLSFVSLPDDVINLVLKSAILSCRDALRFGQTNKRFYWIVRNNQILWRSMARRNLTHDVFKAISVIQDVDWLMEIKHFCKVKRLICDELEHMYALSCWMSQRFYRTKLKLKVRDVKIFYEIAANRGINFCHIITILSDIGKRGIHFCEINPDSPRSHNLTEMYYANVVNAFLIHSFLILDWALRLIKLEQTPEFVVQFCLQWIDTKNIHTQESADNEIAVAVRKVELLLNSSHPLLSTHASDRESWAKGKLKNNQWSRQDNLAILAAIQKVLYHHKSTQREPAMIIHTASIVKALKDGFTIRPDPWMFGPGYTSYVVAASFAAIARRCGVLCELIVFTLDSNKKMHLQWKEDYNNSQSQAYSVNLINGGLEKLATNSNYKYCPQQLLHYLHESYKRSNMALKHWTVDNASYLVNFISNEEEDQQIDWPYDDILPYFAEQLPLEGSILRKGLTIYDVDEQVLDLIMSAVHLNLRRSLLE